MPPSWNRPEVTLAPTSRGTDVTNAVKFGLKVAMLRDSNAWQLVRAPESVVMTGRWHDGASSPDKDTTPAARDERAEGP